MEIIYRSGSIVTNETAYESPELKLARASYTDNLDEVLYLLSKYPSIDINAIVKNSKSRGNGTPLILTGTKEIAEVLVQKGADINLVYNTGNDKITALDSAYREAEKNTLDVSTLIAFLLSKGAKKYSELKQGESL